MLFTDSDLVTPGDLIAIDGESAQVAGVSKISISGLQSTIRQAWSECASILNRQLQVYASYYGAAGAVNHYAAVLNTGLYTTTAPMIMLNRIVAHNWRYDNSPSAIQLWVIYTALRILYANASNRKGEDRYQDKRDRFAQAAIDKWGEFRDQGLPSLVAPLDCPGALHSHGAGTWSVGTIAGSGTVTGQYVVALTYYDAAAYVSQSNKGNAESGSSEQKPVNLASGNVIKVDISGLNPPTGSQANIGLSEGLTFARPATHWNIYAATATTDGSVPVFYYQDSRPVATKTFTFAADPVLSGTLMEQGQFPDPGCNLVFGGSVINRG